MEVKNYIYSGKAAWSYPLGAVLKSIITYIQDYFLPREKEFESRSLSIDDTSKVNKDTSKTQSLFIFHVSSSLDNHEIKNVYIDGFEWYPSKVLNLNVYGWVEIIKLL